MKLLCERHIEQLTNSLCSVFREDLRYYSNLRAEFETLLKKEQNDKNIVAIYNEKISYACKCISEINEDINTITKNVKIISDFLNESEILKKIILDKDIENFRILRSDFQLNNIYRHAPLNRDNTLWLSDEKCNTIALFNVGSDISRTLLDTTKLTNESFFCIGFVSEHLGYISYLNNLKNNKATKKTIAISSLIKNINEFFEDPYGTPTENSLSNNNRITEYLKPIKTIKDLERNYSIYEHDFSNHKTMSYFLYKHHIEIWKKLGICKSYDFILLIKNIRVLKKLLKKHGYYLFFRASIEDLTFRIYFHDGTEDCCCYYFNICKEQNLNELKELAIFKTSEKTRKECTNFYLNDVINGDFREFNRIFDY